MKESLIGISLALMAIYLVLLWNMSDIRKALERIADQLERLADKKAGR